MPYACIGKKQLSHEQMLLDISAFLQFGPRGGDITSLDIPSFSNLNFELPTHIIFYGEPESNVQVIMYYEAGIILMFKLLCLSSYTMNFHEQVRICLAVLIGITWIPIHLLILLRIL